MQKTLELYRKRIRRGEINALVRWNGRRTYSNHGLGYRRSEEKSMESARARLSFVKVEAIVRNYVLYGDARARHTGALIVINMFVGPFRYDDHPKFIVRRVFVL